MIEWASLQIVILGVLGAFFDLEVVQVQKHHAFFLLNLACIKMLYMKFWSRVPLLGVVNLHFLIHPLLLYHQTLLLSIEGIWMLRIDKHLHLRLLHLLHNHWTSLESVCDWN